MEAIDLYKEETTKMEEEGGGHEKVLIMASCGIHGYFLTIFI